LHRLGWDLVEQRKYTEAETPLRECLAIDQKNPRDDWTHFDAQRLLGGSLLGQKKYAEAEPLLLAGYQGLKRHEAKIPPDRKRSLPEALEWLVQLYEATGKPGEAAKWRKELKAAALPEKSAS
jgi:hypothetical protein